MPPAAPSISAGTSAIGEPTSTWKVLGVIRMTSAAWGTLPELSFIPRMFGCSASRATVSGSRLMPVLAGKLYSSTGTGDASATAR